jgi:hypothetical protein
MSRFFGTYVGFSLLCALLVVLRPFNFLSDDGLFYLLIARNIASGHGSSFNGLFPTNGYHPLWECVAALLAMVTPSKQALLIAGIFTQWLFSVVTLLILLRALRPWLQPASLVSFSALILIFFVPFGNLFWSEAPLSMLFIAATFYLLLSPKPVSNVVLGVVLGLAFLSRLDNIFLIACVFVALWWRDRDVRLGFAWLICAAIAGSYVLLNEIYFGHAMPISGAIKSAVYRQHYFDGQLGPYGILSLIGGVGLALINFFQRTRPTNYRIACLVLACSVILHAVYVWALTYGDTVWVWYYVQGYLCVALLVAQSTDGLKLSAAAGCAWFFVVLSIGLSGFVAYAKFARNWSWHDYKATSGQWRDDWVDDVEKSLPADNSVLVVIDLPGTFAYGTSHPVLALDGLTSNYRVDDDIVRYGMAAQLRTLGTAYFLGPILAPGAVYRTQFISQHGVDGGQVLHFFAPLKGSDAGCIRVDDASLLMRKVLPHALLEGVWGIWKLSPDQLTPVDCPAETRDVNIRAIRD